MQTKQQGAVCGDSGADDDRCITAAASCSSRLLPCQCWISSGPQTNDTMCTTTCVSICVCVLQEFSTMLSGLMGNPSMIGAYMNDPRMQLVSLRRSSVCVQRGDGAGNLKQCCVDKIMPWGQMLCCTWAANCTHQSPTPSHPTTTTTTNTPAMMMTQFNCKCRRWRSCWA